VPGLILRSLLENTFCLARRGRWLTFDVESRGRLLVTELKEVDPGTT